MTAMVVGALVAAAVVMGIVSAAEWLQMKLHRRRTRRNRLTW